MTLAHRAALAILAYEAYAKRNALGSRAERQRGWKKGDGFGGQTAERMIDEALAGRPLIERIRVMQQAMCIAYELRGGSRPDIQYLRKQMRQRKGAA